jgi:streptogramin lyase
MIGRMTPGGTLTQFTLPEIPPAAGSPAGTASTLVQPEAIAAGPDGALWFTTENSLIGRISTSGTITEFTVSGLTSSSSIVAGPDGALWFTGVSGKVGRITTAGVVTEFALPSGDSATGITVGPDKALWFAGEAGEVGRITTAGVVTEFAVPDIPPAAGSSSTSGTQVTPAAITTGPDGALWFTGAPNVIGRITTSGVVTEFSAPVNQSFSDGRMDAITVGPDGGLWFIGENNEIGRITTAGVVTEFAVPGDFNDIPDLTLGPDGNLWFTEQEDGSTPGEQPAVGEITPAGVTKVFPVLQGMTLDPSRGVDVDPGAITPGPDGALWFTENGAIGRIATDGTIQQFPLTTPQASSDDITSGPDGDLWFGQEGTDANGNPTWSIGRITTSGTITAYPLPPGTNIAGITAGPGGRIWFTDNAVNPVTNASNAKVGWITPQGKIKMFDLPTKDQRAGELGNIIAGPKDDVWFLDSLSGGSNRKSPAAIGSITARGRLRMYQFVETDSSGSYAPGPPSDLIAGPGGKLWFDGEINDKPGIARISTSGKLGSTIATNLPFIDNMVKLPDGQVWFELYDSGTQADLGLVTRSGTVVSEDLPGISVSNYGDWYGGYDTSGSAMTLGPDGNLWATNGQSTILRISGIETVTAGTQAPEHPKKK